jgi:hypothetical protein
MCPGHVACIREMRNEYSILVRKFKGWLGVYVGRRVVSKVVLKKGIDWYDVAQWRGLCVCVFKGYCVWPFADFRTDIYPLYLLIK